MSGERPDGGRARGRRRVWCEAADLSHVAGAGEALRALGRRRVELIAAVFPATIGQVPGLLDACARASVEVSLWPMIDDARGRWASAATMADYEPFARRVLGAAAGRPVASVFVDLEPPIAALRAALRSPGRAAGLLGRGERAARERLRALAAAAAAAGTTLSAAALPLASQPGRAGAGWQRALGLPLDGVGWEAVHTMMYSSLLEGYSRGLIGRGGSRALVALGARQARARWGERGGLSLGVVGPGALGDERALAGVEALRQDVAAARSEGAEDLALFDLLGAMARPPLEGWLDALVETPAGPPRRTPAGVGALDAVGRAAGVALGTIVGGRPELDSSP